MQLNGGNKCEFWMCWNAGWNQKDVKHDVQFENVPNYCSPVHDQMVGKASWFEAFLDKASMTLSSTPAVASLARVEECTETSKMRMEGKESVNMKQETLV